jgi:hypothetical protein
MADPDPILDAIASHKEAVAALEAVFAGLPTVIDPDRAMAGAEKLAKAVPAERQALQALTGIAPTDGGLSALSAYVEELKARTTLWTGYGANRAATLAASVAEGRDSSCLRGSECCGR